MGDPNEPRLMKPRHDEPRDMDMATGNAGLDGYTRIARRRLPGESTEGPFGLSSYGSGGITPEIGERDWNFGPRFEEDI
jgi:hypothetical protein